MSANKTEVAEYFYTTRYLHRPTSGSTPHYWLPGSRKGTPIKSLAQARALALKAQGVAKFGEENYQDVTWGVEYKLR